MNHPLHEKALRLSKELKRVESELIEVLEKIDALKLFRQMGYSSLFDYTTKALGLTESVAYGFITVSRKTKSVPELKAAIQSGAVTVSQVRRMASVMTKENAEDLLIKVQTLTQREVEKEIAKINPQSAIQERTRYVAEQLIEVRFGASEGFMKKLKRVQDLVSQKKRIAANMESALEEALNLYLEKHDPVIKAERVLKAKDRPNAKIKEHRVEGQELLQRLSSRRVLPARTKHLLAQRDKGQCTERQPDGTRCHQTRWTETHHLRPKQLGGDDCITNLTTLCSTHHKRLHESHDVPVF